MRLSCNGLKTIFCGEAFTLNYTFKLDPTLGTWVPLAALSVQSSRCRSPMLSHSHSDGEFPVKQGENYVVGAIGNNEFPRRALLINLVMQTYMFCQSLTYFRDANLLL